MKALRWFTLIVVIVGACLTGRALYLRAKAELARVLISRAWTETIQSGAPHAPWPWADTHPVGRLRVPRLGYDEYILEGATPRTLAFGPARLLSGANFGEGGNVVLAGHRTSWFQPLEFVTAGDAIEIEWLSPSRHVQKRVYRVEFTRIADPQDLALLSPTAHDALTLVTCYPFGRGPYSPQRYIVRASHIH